jgi:hypothetical protein
MMLGKLGTGPCLALRFGMALAMAAAVARGVAGSCRE